MVPPTAPPFFPPECVFIAGIKGRKKSLTHTFLPLGCCCFSDLKLCLTVFDLMDCSTPGFPVLHYLLEFAQIHVHWISDGIPPSHPLSLPFPLAEASGSLPMSQLCIRWPKYWSFSFSISPSSEYSGLISFRIDYPKDSQEFSPAPQFESINSLTLSLLYGPTLRSVHDYWENHNFDYIYIYKTYMTYIRYNCL